MEKDFFDVFPKLKVKKELEELLDMVFVTKVSMNPGRTHLRVYIETEILSLEKYDFKLSVLSSCLLRSGSFSVFHYTFFLFRCKLFI